MFKSRPDNSGAFSIILNDLALSRRSTLGHYWVEVFNEDNLDPIKTRLGVPFAKGSCHTGEVEGYLVEGHVPAGDIRRLLAEHPRAKGLVLPGMPIGSPGMESPSRWSL